MSDLETTLRFVVDPDSLAGGRRFDPTDRADVVRECWRLIEMTPTDVLLAYLPVLAEYAEPLDL